jgi:hypothetical protein
MTGKRCTSRTIGRCAVLGGLLVVSACSGDTRTGSTDAPAAEPQAVPQSLAMGGSKSVTRFFVTSKGPGRGGDLGGLAGADAHCQGLAQAEGSGDHTWRAYLSVSATPAAAAVNARDRIGSGPWYNSAGILVAANVDELHGPNSAISKQTAVTERLDEVNGVGDTPNLHDILTGSRPDGTAFDSGQDLTCGNWTSSGAGNAQVGHHDRMGLEPGISSWNSVHSTRGCSQDDFAATGGAGLIYCFAID